MSRVVNYVNYIFSKVIGIKPSVYSWSTDTGNPRDPGIVLEFCCCHRNPGNILEFFLNPGKFQIFDAT